MLGPPTSTPSPQPYHLSSPGAGLAQPMLSSSPSSPYSARSPYPDLPRCSLRLAFLVCTVLQVSVACVLVWYLGYESQLTTVGTLSSQLRNQTLSHMIDQVSSQLSNPILAVNEVDLITQQRLLRAQTDSDPTSAIDWSTDAAFYTTLANIIHHYSGVTASALQTSSAVLIAAFLGFNNTDPDGSPPFLAFLNQDAASGWGYSFWISSYQQTQYRVELYNDVNILAETANWFDELPAGDLQRGRAHPIIDVGYVPPSSNNCTRTQRHAHSRAPAHSYRALTCCSLCVCGVGYTTCLALGLQSIASNSSTSVDVGWSIPRGTVNHSTASTTETLSICKPHINRSPNATWMMAVALAANSSNDPRAPFLIQQAQQQFNLTAQGLPPQPIIEWISDVTFDPFSLVVFMRSRLNDFIVDNGAAFICTTTGWVLASTLPGPDLDVLAYMPDLCFPPNKTLAEYSASIQLQHPQGMAIVCSLYANMQSAAWQANLNNVTLQQASSSAQFSWEQSQSVNGEAMYVQYTSLGVPASSFSFILVVYSRVSDYQGNISYNSMLSGVLSAVVVIVSFLVTLILTSCINQPILTLIVAMRAVLGDTPWWQQGKAASPNLSRRSSLKLAAAGPDTKPLPSPSIFAGGQQQSSDGFATSSPSIPGHPVPPSAYPAALPSPSALSSSAAELMGAHGGSLLADPLRRTSSCTSEYNLLTSPQHSTTFISPAASTTRTLASTGASTTTSQHTAPITTTSVGRLQWESAVYSKFVPGATVKGGAAASPPQVLEAPQLHKTTSDSHASVAKWMTPHSPTAARTAHEAALLVPASSAAPPPSSLSSPCTLSPPPMPSVHFSRAAAPAEVSRAGRTSRSEHDDTSSYELDLLLQKWQRTMRMQGIRLPQEWQDDLLEDSERLRELRMGLREARKRYKGRQRQKQVAAGKADPAMSSDDDDDDDRSVFTPADGVLSRAFARVCSAVLSGSSRKRGDGSSRQAVEHSLSASHTSQSSNSSDAHSVSCRCSACQRHRFTVRVFGCGGQFSEVVQLQMTFGAMLFRLRNSALRLEQANTKTRSLVRFVFHEVRVPLNALGLGVEQMHDIIVTRRDTHRQHARHMQQQNALVQRMEDLLHANAYSQLPSLVAQLDDLRFHCPYCSDPEQNVESMDGASLALLRIVQDQISSVTRILNDVLSFQRIEEGEMKLEILPFSVQSMLHNTLHSFQAEFQSKQLRVHTEWVDRVTPRHSTSAQNTHGVDVKEVRLEVHDGGEGVEMVPLHRPPLLVVNRSASQDGRREGEPGWWVLGDQYRLRQVLANFLSNACKFSREGGDLTVTAVLSLQSNVDPATQPSFPSPSSGSDYSAYLQLSVRDTGIGISQSGLASLFQPYSQIRPGALQEGKGSGLGLSICKKIVELHGGGVLVSSKPGEGSVFSFEVPVERLGEEKAAALANGQSEGAEEERENSAAADREEDESKHAGQMEQEYADSPALYPVAPQHQAPVLITPEILLRRLSHPLTLPDTVAEAEADEPQPSLPLTATESSPAAPKPAASSSTASPPMVLDATTLPDAFISTREGRRDSRPMAAVPEGDDGATKAVPASERLPMRRLASLRSPASMSTALTPVERKRGLGTTGSSAGKADSSPPLRALVVEDSAVNRKLLVMMCTSLGLKVESAEDGQFAYDLIAAHLAEQKRHQHTLQLPSPEAATSPSSPSPSLSTVQSHSPSSSPSSLSPASPMTPLHAVECQFDVIFLDDHMPRMTGVECCAALRALGVSIPVFGITANALLEDQQSFVRAGVTAVVTKPMKKTQLIEMIATAKQARDLRLKVHKVEDGRRIDAV